jgi:hypothetical protein
LAKQWSVLESLIHNPPENSRIITIVPGIAQKILDELNGNNRGKRPAKIRRFAEFMANDCWRLTGDTIKFGKSEALKDGQNRLFACVHADKPFRTHVVFGVDDRAFMVIDTGATRTGADAFKIEGVAHARVSAPAVRWIMIYENDPAPPERGTAIDNAALLDYLRNRIDRAKLDEAVERAMVMGKPFPIGALAALFYRFEATDHRTTKKFALDLEKRERGGRKLADRLNNLRKQQMGRLHELQTHALIIQAFNCYRAGQTVTAQRLNWTDGKDFPVV